MREDITQNLGSAKIHLESKRRWASPQGEWGTILGRQSLDGTHSFIHSFTEPTHRAQHYQIAAYM
jgi:hypothetical protein